MKTHIYLSNEDGSKGELLARVDLEVVPGGTYVIDGVSYTLVGKPTFHITNVIRPIDGPKALLNLVELLVSKLP